MGFLYDDDDDDLFERAKIYTNSFQPAVLVPWLSWKSENPFDCTDLKDVAL